ncbi:hypothetical protein [Polyangium jinanense]|uniref:Uncharacterized protein n=1 Tax=Polyangium jinanense TaxID=2829994 RepID=A0A9X4AZT9_9BACT|nr:hypothetical protein [Polyangium jinanense]MDC3988685.1 hypothetical protein [Polyangium jinanense]
MHFTKAIKLVAAHVAAATVIGLALLPVPAASAVNRYKIKPNSPKPEVCDNHGTIPHGTWLQNKPCGYFIGTAIAESSFDVHLTTDSNYHYGRSHGNNNLCAWIPPGALVGSAESVPASCSDATRERFSHRRSFGYDFNARPHEATTGTPISVNPSCGAFLNYYTSSTYDTGVLRDPAPGTPSAEVRYRFTTNGAKPAIVVLDDNLGWVFMDRGCVTDWRGIPFNSEDD